MEIIKQGKLPKDRVFETKCNNCKTEFRFFQYEGKIVYDQRDGDYMRVNCPFCKEGVCTDLKLGK